MLHLLLDITATENCLFFFSLSFEAFLLPVFHSLRQLGYKACRDGSTGFETTASFNNAWYNIGEKDEAMYG